MILSSLLSMRATSELPLLPLSQAMRGTWLWEALGGGDGTSIVVNERNAMQLSAVWTCVNIRAGLLSSLPLKVYQRKDRGRRLAREHRLYKILHDRPSMEDTSYTFRHKVSGSLLLGGNGYAEIAYDGAGRVRDLFPWPKWAVRIELGSRRGDFWYMVTDASGERRVNPEDMLHLRGFCDDGLAGLSVIQNHRRSLGLAVRTEVFAQNFYDNGARASGVLMYPGRLKDPGKENLLSSFNEKQAGVENAGRTILLEEGTKYQQLTIPPNDAQFLETRQLGRAEIAGIYRIPTMLVPGSDDTPPTYASSESFMRYLVDVTLRDDLSNWENEINAKLFPGSDYYAEFDLRDMLRGDSTARAQLHKAMWEVGAKSANDINEDENENPVKGGDRYYVPMNFIPTDRVDDVLDAKLKPDPPPVPAVAEPMKPGSMPAPKQLPLGYQRLFAETVKEIQQWESFSEKRAAAKLLAVVLRPMADDLIGPERGEEFLPGFAAKLAKRVRTISAEQVKSEIERAVDDIRATGGSDA